MLQVKSARFLSRFSLAQAGMALSCCVAMLCVFLILASTLSPTSKGLAGCLLAMLLGAQLQHQRRVALLAATAFRSQHALDGAGEGVWDWNEQTGTIDFSAHYLSMLGYAAGEIDGSFRGWKTLAHPDDLAGVYRAFADHHAGLAPNYAREYRMRCKDGNYKWVLARGRVVAYDAQGRAVRTIGTQTDITHLKAIEQRLSEQNALITKKNIELEEADKVKSEFLANMSHELRTPLNAVLGFTGALLMQLPGPLTDEQDRQLQIVRDSGRHLLAVINQILDLSKIESGIFDLALLPLVCQDLINDVCRTLMPLASQKSIALYLDMPPAPVEVQTDQRLLKQVLINLIGNAIKFTEHGKVTVRLHASGMPLGGARIDVSDTGIGIREEDIGKLFLPFTQIEASLSRRFEGSGLGLSVSKKYARLLGAELEVSSCYGQGSTFSVCLP